VDPPDAEPDIQAEFALRHCLAQLLSYLEASKSATGAAQPARRTSRYFIEPPLLNKFPPSTRFASPVPPPPPLPGLACGSARWLCPPPAGIFFPFLVESMSITLSASADTSKSTELNPRQREMALLAEYGKPELVDWALIEKCEDEIQALQLCVALSRLHYDTVAFKLGIDKGHFTRIMHGQGNLPEKKRTQLMAICRNLAPLQFGNLRFGYKMKEDDLDEQEQKALAILARVQRQKQLRIAA
jgi:hypothetical protein